MTREEGVSRGRGAISGQARCKVLTADGAIDAICPLKAERANGETGQKAPRQFRGIQPGCRRKSLRAACSTRSLTCSYRSRTAALVRPGCASRRSSSPPLGTDQASSASSASWVIALALVDTARTSRH